MKIDQKCDVKSIGTQPISVTMVVNNYETARDGLPPNMLSLLEILKDLPHPRVNNLILKAMVVACRSFKTQKEAADWLGLDPHTLNKYITQGKPFSFSGREHSLISVLQDELKLIKQD